MKIDLFYFEMAIKITGSAQIIGSVGLAETHLFLGLIVGIKFLDHNFIKNNISL